MKNLITYLIVILFAGSAALAQPAAINSLIQKYSGEEGFTSMSLNDANPLLKDMAGDVKAKEALKSVKKLKLLNFDPKKGKNLAKGKQLAQELHTTKPADYDEIMSLQDGGSFVKMFAKIDGKSPSEFIMLATESDGEGILLYMNGDFDMTQIRNVAKILQKNREGKGK